MLNAQQQAAVENHWLMRQPGEITVHLVFPTDPEGDPPEELLTYQTTCNDILKLAPAKDPKEDEYCGECLSGFGAIRGSTDVDSPYL